jgi:hypothetical protein
MRTTVDLPDSLFRKTKAVAALRGSSMKDLIVQALDREVTGRAATEPKRRRVKLPLIQSPGGRKVDLTNFDFDDLLG